MREFKYVIKDAEGIHARPASQFVKVAAAFACDVTISKDGEEANAKRIFAVMGLGVKYGEEVTVRAEGELEDEAVAALSKFLEENL